MTTGILAIAIAPWLLVVLFLHALTVRRFRTRPFGVRVEPAYAASPEASRITAVFVRRLYLTTAAAGALAVALSASGFLVAATLSPLVLIAGASLAFRDGWRHTAPHALPVSAIPAAALAPRDRTLPGGLPAAIGPFLLLILAGLVLAAHWDRIPDRFPIHWGIDGKPNGWSNRTLTGVFWPLGLAAAIQLMMLGIAWLSAIDVRRTPVARATRQVLVAAAWLIALVFSVVTLTPLSPQPPPILAILLPVLGFVVWAIWITAQAEAEPSAQENPVPESCWKWGQFYYNPGDPALFVEKRFGLGLTLNFARPASWAILGAALLLPLIILGFAALVKR